MTAEAWILLLVILFLSSSSVWMYIWAKKAGQFDDAEAIKYRMLNDEEREGY
jgi:cbb3-type cytochrome oxidase maturation protein